MNDRERYSFKAIIVYTNEDEYEETFETESEAREWAEDQYADNVAGYQIVRVDWYWRCDAVVWQEWYD